MRNKILQNRSVSIGITPSVGVAAFNKMNEDNAVLGEYKVQPSTLMWGENQFTMPLRLSLSSAPDDKFSFPLDPIISISSDNQIVKRDIARGEIRGTVKEMWQRSDWKISVSGVISTRGEGESEQMRYYIKRLLDILNAEESLIIECDVLNNDFDITRVCVESYDFPFTKGKENQSFTLSLISDDSYNLEIEEE